MIQIWTSDFERVFITMAVKVGTLKLTAILCTIIFIFWKLLFACLVSTHGNDRPHDCLLANLKPRE